MDQSNYTLPGIMHYLQNQYTIIEKNKIINELEKSELKMKITKLESERNSLILENSHLQDRIRKLELSNPSETNGKTDKTTKEENIDTTDLMRARQFLKTTTNEILYLLNSPAIDNTDPLELTKEEPDYVVPQQQPPITQHPVKHIQDTPMVIDDIDYGTAQEPQIETDSETIIDIDDEPSKEPFKEPTPKLEPHVKSELIFEGHKDLRLLLPLKYMHIDPFLRQSYIYSGPTSTQTITQVDIDGLEFSTLYASSRADINQRVFCVVPIKQDSLVFEGCSTYALGGYITICQKEPPSAIVTDDGILQSFDSPVVSLEYQLGDTVLIALLLGDGSLKIFELEQDGKVSLTPHKHTNFTELPNEINIISMKFNSLNEITLITNDCRILRYDFTNNELIYNLNMNSKIIDQDTADSNWLTSGDHCFQLSPTHFIHVLNSTSLHILDLLTQDLQIFQLDHTPFSVKTISICHGLHDDQGRTIFSLNYSNGVVEIYNTAILDEKYHLEDSKSLTCMWKFDYYENYQTAVIIKDVLVDLINNDTDEIEVFVAGSDLNLQKFLNN